MPSSLTNGEGVNIYQFFYYDIGWHVHPIRVRAQTPEAAAKILVDELVCTWNEIITYYAE